MRYSLVFGGLAGIIIIVVSTAFVTAGLLGHSSSPVMGYLAMLVGLTMIFVGVKRYRDVEQGGVITFGKALLVGLGISLIAAIIYAAAFEVYAGLSGFDLATHFGEITRREMQAAGASAAEIEIELAGVAGIRRGVSQPARPHPDPLPRNRTGLLARLAGQRGTPAQSAGPARPRRLTLQAGRIGEASLGRLPQRKMASTNFSLAQPIASPAPTSVG